MKLELRLQNIIFYFAFNPPDNEYIKIKKVEQITENVSNPLTVSIVVV